MSEEKIQKKFHLPEDVAKLISDLSDEYGMTESAFVDGLIHNYAIDIGMIQGVKNHVLEEGLSFKSENNIDYEDILKDLKIIRSILNNIDKRSYVMNDMMNLLMLYLRPENEIKTFPSTDTKLSIQNLENLHSYVKKSLDNYEDRLKYFQIEKANS